ncbi:transposase [Streptomyces clavuligerus]|nr:transposase [Streptomyces clavuligerus]QPJ97123.1 transposase [Streptomyces clavuligerus]
MGRRSPCPEEFRRDAVALYRAGGGRRTYAVAATELGITGETLRMWVRKDTGVNVSATGGGSGPGSQAGEPVGLRVENARLVKARKKKQLEHEILRRAAIYFAREVK